MNIQGVSGPHLMPHLPNGLDKGLALNITCLLYTSLSIEDQIASGKIPVITPVGFTEHSVKENVYAGKGMGRRSNYQYGILLTPGVTGKLAQGIGMGQSTGTVSFMTPSYEITQSGEKPVSYTHLNSDASEGAALDVSETSVRAIRCASSSRVLA